MHVLVAYCQGVLFSYISLLLFIIAVHSCSSKVSLPFMIGIILELYSHVAGGALDPFSYYSQLLHIYIIILGQFAAPWDLIPTIHDWYT